RSLLARDEDLPSGDELGAQFEQFLAQQSGDESGRPNGPEDGPGAA
ncbi:MAG TPA: PAC2 family protein, partial [Mycobacterium sp.]|nr:PAC2 family protein [Mycobacterium sp.]